MILSQEGQLWFKRLAGNWSSAFHKKLVGVLHSTSHLSRSGMQHSTLFPCISLCLCLNLRKDMASPVLAGWFITSFVVVPECQSRQVPKGHLPRTVPPEISFHRQHVLTTHPIRPHTRTQVAFFVPPVTHSAYQVSIFFSLVCSSNNVSCSLYKNVLVKTWDRTCV